MPVMMSQSYEDKNGYYKGKMFLPPRPKKKRNTRAIQISTMLRWISSQNRTRNKSFPCLASSIYSLVAVSNISKIATQSKDSWIAWLPWLRTNLQTIVLWSIVFKITTMIPWWRLEAFYWASLSVNYQKTRSQLSRLNLLGGTHREMEERCLWPHHKATSRSGYVIDCFKLISILKAHLKTLWAAHNPINQRKSPFIPTYTFVCHACFSSLKHQVSSLLNKSPCSPGVPTLSIVHNHTALKATWTVVFLF